MRAVDCTVEGSLYGLNSYSSGTEQVYHSCTFSGTSNAAVRAGPANKFMGLQNCIFNDKVEVSDGFLSIVDSDFTYAGRHVDILSNTLGATLLGNRFDGNAEDINDASSGACVKISHTPLLYKTKPTFSWDEFNARPQDLKPGNQVLYDVTEYGAVADMSSGNPSPTDNTAAFQSALDAAGAAGGGIVMVPPGWYDVPGTLTIPSDVELRGTFEGSHDPETDEVAPLIFVSNDQGNAAGTPFITMEADSGLNGLAFYSPNQVIPAIDYPFLVRGAGSNIYIKNVGCHNVANMIDLATNRCDNAWIERVFANSLQTLSLIHI